MDARLDVLNPAQREAVLWEGGPVLVMAGAGSGKTRVLTHRIAHLILDRGVSPASIVAVTFTNKAAKEMQERVVTLLGTAERGARISTFHSLCLRILRRDGARIGLRPGFTVYDTADQLAVVKQILREERTQDDVSSPQPFLWRISRAKNALERPEALASRAHSPDARLEARVYERYEAALRAANAVDFDDLLIRTLELLRGHADVAEAYATGCEHLLVDEFQDTNRPQYLLVRALSSVHGNVFVVGDEDQSIYRFRGADLRNILDFEADHAGARQLKLEQNYRSTGTILDAAGAVISRNLRRKGKTLWTENDRGERVALYRAPDDRMEAAWVARRIRHLAPETPHEDIAILYRTNAQSRQLEEILRRDRIPYHVVGSVQFYERKEIRDFLAYLKLVANPSDGVSFRRIVNTPARGIGDGTMKVLEDAAREKAVSLEESAALAVDQALVPGKQARTLREFLDLLTDLRRLEPTTPLPDLLRHVLRATDYEDFLEKSYPGQAADRIENVRALVSAAAEYVEEDPSPSLGGFLERSALVSDADEVGRGRGVALMTIHCAKGLEFGAVFVTGLEENLFPHARSAASSEELEEERRLCYVAMTRAQRSLFLSHAEIRLVQGVRMPNLRSRFLDEIPADLLEEDASAAQEILLERSAWPGESSVWRGSSAARAAGRARPGRDEGLVPASRLQDTGDGYPIGAVVVHPRFGSGKILDREGSGKNLKLTIRFVHHGSKKILPAYTELAVAAAHGEVER